MFTTAARAAVAAMTLAAALAPQTAEAQDPKMKPSGPSVTVPAAALAGRQAVFDIPGGPVGFRNPVDRRVPALFPAVQAARDYVPLPPNSPPCPNPAAHAPGC